MSKIECPVCGKFRTVEQVYVAESRTFQNPPCWNCGDPGWDQPEGADDPLAGRDHQNNDDPTPTS